MGKYSIALALFLSAATTTTVDGFHNFQPNSLSHIREQVSSRKASSRFQRGVSTSSSYSDSGESLGDAFNSVTNAAKDSISQAVSDFPDTDADEIALKQQQVGQRVKTYSVTLPLASRDMEGKAPLLSMGFTVGQINAGRTFEELELNMDTLEYVKPQDDNDGIEVFDRTGIARRVDGDFKGLVVASVSKGGAAWAAGVRAGDILRTTSATMGSKLWPKSTLDGVRSAISSRKATSGSVEFEFQRFGEAVDNQFELSLTRPIGLELRETEDGYVEVSGFTENAPTLVQYAVKAGDRVLAVESSLGGKMWPVSTVDGVISAVTARLPGQPITMRFERVEGSVDTATLPAPAKTVVAQTSVTTVPDVPQKELLKRCRDVIQRYMGNDQVKDKFVGKYAVPGLVADKVVDALASAGAVVDRITLSMIMEAYLSCGQSQKAIDIFEAVVGVNSNGSTQPATVVVKGNDDMQIVASTDALDVFTVGGLLKAHAKMGNMASIKRVMFALEGKKESVVDGLQVASWPGTGENGVLKPDTGCYNTVLSAAADLAATDGLDFALEMFDRMADPKANDESAATRNLASYNIMINALTNGARFDEAIDLFYMVKNLGMKPDKYTYTALVKAVATDSDIQELLYDMREQGVVADAVTYNTLIKKLCDQRKIVAAKKIVNLMEESGVAPDSRTYGLLMKGLIDAKKPSAALTLFETACTGQRTVALTENVHLYTTAMTAAAAIGDHERAVDLMSRMTSLGIKPNQKTMTTLLGACLAARRPDLAVGVFRRISDPDGYAVNQGITALSENGDFEEALSLLTKAQKQRRFLSGKQQMRLYQNLIHSSLSSGDFVFARKAFDGLLGKGNIPSKAIYQSMFDAMRLFPSTSNGRLEKDPNDDPDSENKFRFLLYVLDSIGKRNLNCQGPLYSAILSYGFRMGGLPKKMATLLVSAKTATVAGVNKRLMDESERSRTNLVSGWSDLFERYNEVKDELKVPESLPELFVQVSTRDVIKVLKAEKNLSFVKRTRSQAASQ